MAVAFGVLLLWLVVALSLAAAEGDLALCGGSGSQFDAAAARRYKREDFDADGRAVRACCDRAAHHFYFSTEDAVAVIRRALLSESIPSDDEFGRHEAQWHAWLCDARLWAVYKSSAVMYLLRHHNVLSIWFHHPFDVRQTGFALLNYHVLLFFP